MMECCLVGEWVLARGEPLVIAQKLWNGPYMGDVEGVLVGNGMMDTGWEILMDDWSENFGRTPAGRSGRNFGWKV